MKTKKETIKLILKKDHAGEIIAFYVNDRCSYGYISSMTLSGGHSEASIFYYWNQKNPTRKEAAQFIKQYEKLYDCKVERRRKMTHNDRMKIWGLL